MEIVYVGLDLGSSSFQQVAIRTDGAIKVNRSFTTSEGKLRAVQWLGPHRLLRGSRVGCSLSPIEP